MLAPQGRVVMLSGANRGIGRAIAERLYADGYSLSLGVRNPEAMAPLAEPLDRDRVLVCRYDAAEPDAGDRWVVETRARFGRIDALINCAGILRPVTLEDHDEAALDEMWAINVKAPMRVIRAALPHLRTVGSGRVVNLASMSGKRVKGPWTGYPMSKFAVVALTQAVRNAGWEDGVRATALCPGYVATDMPASVPGAPAPATMTQPADLAALVSTLLALPNTAAVDEIQVNCAFEAR